MDNEILELIKEIKQEAFIARMHAKEITLEEFNKLMVLVIDNCEEILNKYKTKKL